MTLPQCVILLHGLGRTAASMRKLENDLQRAGFAAVNVRYPSTRHPIETLAELAIPSGLAQCPTGSRIHFVTHSLGGILVRRYLSRHPIDGLGRVVMLAPPNHGTPLVDWARRLPGFRLMTGPAGLQLGTGADSVPNRLGAAGFEAGIIAGTRSINVFLWALLPKPNDGRFSVASTKLAGMADHLAVPVSHPLIMTDRRVIAQTIHFLKHGRFERKV